MDKIEKNEKIGKNSKKIVIAKIEIKKNRTYAKPTYFYTTSTHVTKLPMSSLFFLTSCHS